MYQENNITISSHAPYTSNSQSLANSMYMLDYSIDLDCQTLQSAYRCAGSEGCIYGMNMTSLYMGVKGFIEEKITGTYLFKRKARILITKSAATTPVGIQMYFESKFHYSLLMYDSSSHIPVWLMSLASILTIGLFLLMCVKNYLLYKRKQAHIDSNQLKLKQDPIVQQDSHHHKKVEMNEINVDEGLGDEENAEYMNIKHILENLQSPIIAIDPKEEDIHV